MIKIIIQCPTDLADVAAKIGKAFDPDIGGEKSFYAVYPSDHSEESPKPALYLETGFYATQEFSNLMRALLASPSNLFDYCKSDYAARWPSLTPPTLDECEKFSIGATMVDL